MKEVVKMKRSKAFICAVIIAVSTAIAPISASAVQPTELYPSTDSTYKYYDELRYDDDTNIYYFRAPATGTYRIRTKNTDFDSYGVLKIVGNSPRTGDEWENDDSGIGSNFKITADLFEGEDCWIYVSSYDSEGSGDYTLTIDYEE